MARKVVTLKAVPNLDAPLDDLNKVINFYTLEGDCKSCGVGAYSLIINDFKENRRDRAQSVFRTTCMCCNAKNIYYMKNVTT